MSLLSIISLFGGTVTNVIPPVPASNTYKVKAGGTVGVDCDYTSITAAIAAITTATVNNQYKIEVLNGTYLENGPSNTGIILKDYVHIVGQSREGVIIKNNNEGATGPEEASFDVIRNAANCIISNVTIHAHRCKYCIHADATTVTYDFILNNVTLQHFGGQQGNGYDLGFGLRKNQRIFLINVSSHGLGIYGHGDQSTAGRSLTEGFTLVFQGGWHRGFQYTDYEEYGPNQIIVSPDTFIGRLYFTANSSTYDGGANTLSNRGYKPAYCTFTGHPQIDEVAYDAESLILLNNRPHHITGFNEKVTNKNASTIAQGYAVKLLADAGLANTYADITQLGYRQADLYNGSGVFLGFAQEDIAASANGLVQISGTPQAYFNTAGGNVVYGDALEINASGQVIKRSTGVIIGYALAAKSANGLVKIKLV